MIMLGSPQETLRDPSTMSENELLAEMRHLDKISDQESTSDPAALMSRIMPGYRHRPHLTVISQQMRRIHLGEIDRLLITVPPQTGKTITAVVGGSVWWLANHPTHRVVIGSYGDSLAVDRGRESKKLVKEQGHRYGLYLARGSETVQNWKLTTGGGVLSVGIGAGVTGHPGDIAFIDDPHKSREEADSLRMRDRAEKWLSADIISRLSPGAPLIMILTRWHPDDLAARVVAQEGTVDKGGRWQIIRMPALCDDPEHDPLGRKAGDPLPHPKIKICDVSAALRHWHDKRSGSSVQDWHSLYMCDPKPSEGALLSRGVLRAQRCFAEGSNCYPCDQKPTRSAVAVDPSGGGRDTAGIIGGYLGTDKRLYLTHDKTKVMSSDRWSTAACELAFAIDADVIVFESNYGGDQALSLIRTAWSTLRTNHREETRAQLLANEPRLTARDVEHKLDKMSLPYSGMCPRIKSVRAKKNKRLRAEPTAQQWIEDRIRTAAYLPELEEEWATWQLESSDSPGRIDASVYLAYEMLATPKAGSSQPTDTVRGSLPVTGTSPLDMGSTGSSFGPLG